MPITVSWIASPTPSYMGSTSTPRTDRVHGSNAITTELFNLSAMHGSHPFIFTKEDYAYVDPDPALCITAGDWDRNQTAWLDEEHREKGGSGDRQKREELLPTRPHFHGFHVR